MRFALLLVSFCAFAQQAVAPALRPFAEQDRAKLETLVAQHQALAQEVDAAQQRIRAAKAEDALVQAQMQSIADKACRDAGGVRCESVSLDGTPTKWGFVPKVEKTSGGAK